MGLGYLSGRWGDLRLVVRTKREMMSFISGNYKFYFHGLLRTSSGNHSELARVFLLPRNSSTGVLGVLNSRELISKYAHFMSILNKICVLPTANQIVQRGKYLPKFCLAK